MRNDEPEYIFDDEIKHDNDDKVNKKKNILGWIPIIIVIVVLFGLFRLLFAETPKTTSTNSRVEKNYEQINKTNKKSSLKYKEAIVQVKALAEQKHMSRKAIYKKFNVDGGQFSEDAITYALENIDIDYKENALITAKNHMSKMRDPSKEVVYELLTLDDEDGGFTKQEAQYAIDKLGLE